MDDFEARSARPLRLYTPGTLAERWGVSGMTVRNMIKRGQILAFKLGEKLLRIRLEDVEAFERDNACAHGERL
jgi:excisionase family DNA binding protein